MIDSRCTCGEIYHADEKYIGRQIKCEKCGRVIEVIEADRSNNDHGFIPIAHETKLPYIKNIKEVITNNRKYIAIAIILIVVFGIYYSTDKENHKSNKSPTDGKTVEVPNKPISPVLPPVSLPTGANIIKPRGKKGLGSLEIVNGTKHDAVAKLVDALHPKRLYRYVYIKSDDKVEIGNIGVGVYKLKFRLGMDWDRAIKRFRRDSKQSEFEDIFTYNEVETTDGVNYRTYKVTLHPVPQGQAHTRNISDNDFDADDMVQDDPKIIFNKEKNIAL